MSSRQENLPDGEYCKLHSIFNMVIIRNFIKLEVFANAKPLTYVCVVGLLVRSRIDVRISGMNT